MLPPISKFNVGLKSHLRQGLLEQKFYGHLLYKLKKIVGTNNFSAQFTKKKSHYKNIGYDIHVLLQIACLVVNPNTVGNFRSGFSLRFHVGGSNLRLYEGSDLKTYL